MANREEKSEGRTRLKRNKIAKALFQILKINFLRKSSDGSLNAKAKFKKTHNYKAGDLLAKQKRNNLSVAISNHHSQLMTA